MFWGEKMEKEVASTYRGRRRRFSLFKDTCFFSMICPRWSMASQHCWIVPVFKYKNISKRDTELIIINKLFLQVYWPTFLIKKVSLQKS